MLYSISNKNVIYKFSPKNKAAININPGDTIEFETLDCFSEQIKTEDYKIDHLDWNRINPATGPVYVKSASTSDTLKITIEKIDVKNTAVIATGKDMGLFGNFFNDSYVKILDIKDNYIYFGDSVKTSIKPMIGVIGVAPYNDEISCGTPGHHGGNMDNTMIGEGSTIYFPIFNEGALFALGDVHAIMGDGEVCVCGAEVSAKVTVKIELIKDTKINNPILTNEKYFTTIAAEDTLDKAVETSVFDMFNLLRNKTHLKDEEIAMLFSLFGNTEICQVVDPKKTARFVMPKSILKDVGFSCNLLI